MTSNIYSMILWIICSIAAIAVIPFMQTLLILTGSTPLEINPITVIVVALQGMIVSGLLIFCGMKFSQKIGIRFLLLEKNIDFKKHLIKPGIVVGILSTILMILVDKLLPTAPLSLNYLMVNIPPLYGLLGSIYGAFNEEVMMRLFFFSGLALLLMKLFKDSISKTALMWICTLFAALFFGLGHIPSYVHKIDAETPLLVFRVLMLNAISGISFGYLFWQKGFETAVFAHLINDLIMYFVIPLLFS